MELILTLTAPVRSWRDTQRWVPPAGQNKRLKESTRQLPQGVEQAGVCPHSLRSCEHRGKQERFWWQKIPRCTARRWNIEQEPFLCPTTCSQGHPLNTQTLRRAGATWEYRENKLILSEKDDAEVEGTQGLIGKSRKTAVTFRPSVCKNAPPVNLH